MGLFGKKKNTTPVPQAAPQPAPQAPPTGDGNTVYNGNPNQAHVGAIDAVLAQAYDEYFAHLPFATPGTPSGNAFAELVATAERDMERHRTMFTVATNYDDAVLNDLLTNRTPEKNRLYYGALFKTGEYCIIAEDNVYSVMFIDEVPYCVAMALLLMVQKLPAGAHSITIELEPNAPFYMLQRALELVKICDPSFGYNTIIGEE